MSCSTNPNKVNDAILKSIAALDSEIPAYNRDDETGGRVWTGRDCGVQYDTETIRMRQRIVDKLMTTQADVLELNRKLTHFAGKPRPDGSAPTKKRRGRRKKSVR